MPSSSLENFDISRNDIHDIESENLTDEKIESFNSQIQEAVDAQSIELRNTEAFQTQKARFLYGFTEHTDKRKGFIKVARKSDTVTSQQLKRESDMMDIVWHLGIPAVDQYTSYKEIPDGYTIVELERLDASQGELLVSSELIAAANPEYGTWAAAAMLKATGKIIPEHIDKTLFKEDERNKSSESFWKVWQESEDKIFNCPEKDRSWISPVIFNDLRHLFLEASMTLPTLIEKNERQEISYFVHNDTAPNNFFFDMKKGQAILLDFEHGGISHNTILAELTDYGNFYGRAWQNPDMQEKFITHFLNAANSQNLDETYAFLRAVMIYGSVYFAKYAMDSNHPEHQMAKKLIEGLPNQLEQLKKKYLEKTNIH